MRALPLLLLALLAPPVRAQDGEPAREVTADLDADGQPESYRIEDSGNGTVDLLIEEAGGTERVRDVAWTGSMAGQLPELTQSPAGSVLLSSGNDSIGRNRWRLTLTLAHREGTVRVAGITYDWYDTLDPETGWGNCDLNLLSGRGVMTGPEGESEIAAARAAPAVAEWRETDLPEFLPAECFG